MHGAAFRKTLGRFAPFAPFAQFTLAKAKVFQLRVWQHEGDDGMRDDVSSDERARIKDLEREVKELCNANEILKLASVFLPRRNSTADSSPEGFC